MSRVFITGSTDGLGYAAARTLIEEGHEVVLHARSRDRAAAFADFGEKSLGIVLGDLSSSVATEQVNAIGRMDAIIHNAGILSRTQPECDSRRARKNSRGKHLSRLMTKAGQAQRAKQGATSSRKGAARKVAAKRVATKRPRRS
jgi:NAD(P)-dependent dehydrogenase (short-subunit alcohol dehydrogenase family)